MGLAIISFRSVSSGVAASKPQATSESCSLAEKNHALQDCVVVRSEVVGLISLRGARTGVGSSSKLRALLPFSRYPSLIKTVTPSGVEQTMAANAAWSLGICCEVKAFSDILAPFEGWQFL